MSEPKTILCYGDSNTRGSTPYDWVENMNRFPLAELWTTHLAAAMGDGWRVINEGLGGRTVAMNDPIEGAHKNGMTLLPAIFETHKPIDLVVLMLGTNDLKMRFSLPASDIALANERMIEAILKGGYSPDPAGPKILLVAPPPVKEVGRLKFMFAGGAEKSKQFGTFYADVADRTGVAFLDAGAHISVSDEDGIHYSADTHRILGAAIADAVKGMI